VQNKELKPYHVIAKSSSALAKYPSIRNMLPNILTNYIYGPASVEASYGDQKGSILALSFSPDGKMIAAGGTQRPTVVFFWTQFLKERPVFLYGILLPRKQSVFLSYPFMRGAKCLHYTG
jgi:WD40 repeat protein